MESKIVKIVRTDFKVGPLCEIAGVQNPKIMTMSYASGPFCGEVEVDVVEDGVLGADGELGDLVRHVLPGVGGGLGPV